MSAEAQEYLVYIAFFLFGFLGGRGWSAMAHAREVQQWKEIARKAQQLNALANSLEMERRVNGDR